MSETEQPPVGPGKDTHRVLGIAVALGVVFLLLTGVITYAVYELRQNLGEVYGAELRSLAGEARRPLAAGANAEYEDGVRVIVTAPHRVSPAPSGARTYALSATWVNDSDEPLLFRTDSHHPVDAWAGPPSDERDHTAQAAVRHANHDATGRRLPAALAPGTRVTVPLRFTVFGGADEMTLRYAPSDLRDTAYWRLVLRAHG